jgi:hypothetical protein
MSIVGTFTAPSAVMEMTIGFGLMLDGPDQATHPTPHGNRHFLRRRTANRAR